MSYILDRSVHNLKVDDFVCALCALYFVIFCAAFVLKKQPPPLYQWIFELWIFLIWMEWTLHLLRHTKHLVKQSDAFPTARKQKQRKEEAPRVPRSLFDRPNSALVKMRREMKMQKLKAGLGMHKQPMRPSTLPTHLPPKPIMEQSEGHLDWLIHEDWALLQVHVHAYKGMVAQLFSIHQHKHILTSHNDMHVSISVHTVCTPLFPPPPPPLQPPPPHTTPHLRNISTDSLDQTFHCWFPHHFCLQSLYMEWPSASSPTEILSWLLQIKPQDFSFSQAVPKHAFVYAYGDTSFHEWIVCHMHAHFVISIWHSLAYSSVVCAVVSPAYYS